MRAVWTFFVLTLAVLAGSGQTNLGVGAIVVDCAGRTNLVWTNVGYRVVLEKGTNGSMAPESWCGVMDVRWLDRPPGGLNFSVPLASVEDRAFYRLVSWE